jgi:8-oxo-dGTP pyrophosphatase MutT (NUDIX family)
MDETMGAGNGMRAPVPMARDGVQFLHHSRGQDWLQSWHTADVPPDGKNHGSAGVCVTTEGHVILITENGKDWDLPAGRPESGEDWRATLEREVLEETCCRVQEAVLLGFARGVCTRGHEEGLVLVRSLWRAEVILGVWDPKFETIDRKILSPKDALPWLGHWRQEILHRLLTEAGFDWPT